MPWFCRGIFKSWEEHAVDRMILHFGDQAAMLRDNPKPVVANKISSQVNAIVLSQMAH